MQFKLGELFCGPGGLAWGAINASIENFKIVHQWANDYDKDTCETYRKNICPNCLNTVYQEDVRNLDITKLAPIDVLAFGFPCNDFSAVGKQKGMDGKFGGLYSYAVKALKHFKPKWFVAENVPGLMKIKKGEVFKRITDDFKDVGYRLVIHLFKFEEYGVPQTRHRLIIVGIRNDIKVEYKVPDPKPYSEGKDNSCKAAIESPAITVEALNNEKTEHSSTVLKRLSYIRPGENAFTADLPKDLQLNIKGARISQIYKRLDPNKPSYTVTGSGGGGTHIYHWKENRSLTNRERARLQTFPDDFVFIGKKDSVRKQIGMAVPCAGAKIIFETILKSFAGIDYPSIKPSVNI